MIRIAALLALIGGILAAGSAAAQFDNNFGQSPPRPPADIPNGPFPPQPPPVDYPGQAAPAYPAGPPGYYRPPPPQSAIEAQPLPPPPGASVAPAAPPNQRYRHAPGLPPALASQPANVPPSNRSAPAAATPPPDDTVVEAPTPHIQNGRAVFAGLDKITGRTTTFDAAIGETVQFGALQVTPRACYTRPPTAATNTDAFVEVDELTLKGQLQRIFTGWMFASSPGLNAIEHPIYDVWLTGCESPLPTDSAASERQPAPALSQARPAERQDQPASPEMPAPERR